MVLFRTLTPTYLSILCIPARFISSNHSTHSSNNKTPTEEYSEGVAHQCALCLSSRGNSLDGGAYPPRSGTQCQQTMFMLCIVQRRRDILCPPLFATRAPSFVLSQTLAPPILFAGIACCSKNICFCIPPTHTRVSQHSAIITDSPNRKQQNTNSRLSALPLLYIISSSLHLTPQ